jgi:3-oxoacyl-[acyl-carrier-protein] synthase-3
VIRPIEDPPPGTSELGARASRAALASAGIDPADVDFIVFATINPDVTFPGSACYLQDKLGCRTVGALDVRAQCAGFICALMVADQFIRNHQYERVLAVGAEMHSVWVDYSPAGVDLARRFGDGAGAVVLGSGSGGGVLAVALHSDGRRHDRFWCEYPASRQYPTRVTKENLRARKHLPTMDVADVRSFGLEKLPAVVREVAARAGLGVAAIDHFILSHVLPEVAGETARQLGISEGRAIIPSLAYGHLGGAALPLALSEAVAAGRIARGSRVCLAAAGAGYAWGAALVEV